MINFNDIVDCLTLYKPESILDIGVGYGYRGVVCRDLLESSENRYTPDKWKTIIVGVLVNEPDSPILYEGVYTAIEKTDNLDLNRLGGFDLVFINERNYSKEFIDTLKQINKEVVNAE